MNRRNLFLASLFLLYGAPHFAVASDSVDIAEIEVAGIKFADDSYRVKELLGEPVESGPRCDDCIDIMDSWYVYDGIRVHFLQYQVIHIEVESEGYRLASGIGVGSAKEEVTAEYGEPLVTEQKAGLFFTYAITVQNGKRTGHTLDFLLQDGVVIGFKVGPERTGSRYP